MARSWSRGYTAAPGSGVPATRYGTRPSFLLENGANPKASAGGRLPVDGLPVDVIDSIDLFAPARAQRPDDMARVKEQLSA